MQFVYLAVAILAEVVATSALKATNGFTVLRPSLVVILGYGTSFYFLSLALRSINIGIAYALWSGLGIVLISALGWLLYRQALDAAAVIGMGLIVAGVGVIFLFSRTVAH